jgi:hypothetical protein
MYLVHERGETSLQGTEEENDEELKYMHPPAPLLTARSLARWLACCLSLSLQVEGQGLTRALVCCDERLRYLNCHLSFTSLPPYPPDL